MFIKCFKKVLSLIKQLFFYVVILFAIVTGTPSFAGNNLWQSLPLTTEAQYKSGVKGGEGFQKVISIVYAPSNPDIVYFGTDTAQVWKSLDGGRNWFSSGNGFSANGARSLFVFPDNANNVLAAGFLGRERERVGDHLKPLQGIFLSTDGAQTWSLVYRAEFYKQDSTGSLFAIDSRTKDDANITIYAGAYNSGLLVSEDNGKHWRSAGFKLGHIIDMEELPAKPGTLIIASTKGLYQFKDGKIKRIGKGLLHSPLSISVSPAVPERVYAVTNRDGVFLSDDMGKNFINISKGLPVVGINYSDLAVSPVDANILYLGTHKGYRKGPFYSNNAGNSWHRSISINEKKLTSTGGFYFSSPFSPNPVKPLVALSSANGKARILRTVNGGKTWFYSGSGYTGARIQDIVFKDNAEIILSLTDHGVWVSSKKEQVFKSLSIPEKKRYSSGSVAISDKIIIASIGGWKEKTLVISRDEGNEWEEHREIMGRLLFIKFHPQNKKIIYAGSYRSDDYGKTWKKLRYEVAAMSSKKGDVVYAVGEKKSKIYKSTNRGLSWSELPEIPDKVLIYDLELDPVDEKRMYIASNMGVYIFNGRTWLHRGEKHGLRSDNHGFNQVKSIAIDPTNSNIVYAGKWAPGKGLSNGMFQSKDKGITWSPFNFNLGSNYNVWAISVSPYDGAVYAGTTYGLKKYMVREGK